MSDEKRPRKSTDTLHEEIAGLLGVGVSGKIPGVGEIEIDRPGDIERAAPRVELRNEAAELPEVAP